jgi:hypothetical protein
MESCSKIKKSLVGILFKYRKISLHIPLKCSGNYAVKNQHLRGVTGVFVNYNSPDHVLYEYLYLYY